MARVADGKRTVQALTPPAMSETMAAIQCIRSGLEGISTPARNGRITPPPWTISKTVTASRGSPLV